MFRVKRVFGNRRLFYGCLFPKSVVFGNVMGIVRRVVPELACFREQKAVLRVFVPKKCCLRECKGNCPEVASELSGFLGTVIAEK